MLGLDKGEGAGIHGQPSRAWMQVPKCKEGILMLLATWCCCSSLLVTLSSLLASAPMLLLAVMYWDPCCAWAPGLRTGRSCITKAQ
jgi:hypothetical protein